MNKLSKDEKEELAAAVDSQIMTCINQIRFSTMLLASLLKPVREQDLYITLGYVSFEAYVSQPAISLKPKTANKYIDVFTELTEKKKLEFEEIKTLQFDRAELLSKLNNPQKYIDSAKDSSFSDFKKNILKGELNIDVDKEVHKKKNEIGLNEKVSRCPKCGYIW